MPNNYFKRFKIECRDNPANVIVAPEAVTDARVIYKLNTREQLLKFIGNDGLNNVTHFNIALWKKNPDKGNPLNVYDYKSNTNGVPYYIAIIFIPIFFGKITNKWRLKSFHLPDNTHFPMLDQLSKLLHQPLEGNDD